MKTTILLLLFACTLNSQTNLMAYDMDLTDVIWNPSTNDIYKCPEGGTICDYYGTTFFNKKEDIYSVLYSEDGVGYKMTNIAFVDDRDYPEDYIGVWKDNIKIGYLIQFNDYWYRFSNID